MGGMTTLEYPLNTPQGYIRHIIPIATSARHSAWCISWGEAQRQSIYSDPAYDDGYYCYSDEEGEDDDAVPNETEEERKRRIEERQPTRGLAAARMAALLTYRSRDSFESRFGRKYGQPAKRGRGGALSPGGVNGRKRGSGAGSGTVTPRGEDNLRAHNDGHRARKDSTGSSKAGTPVLEKTREVLEQLHVPLPTVVDQQDQTQTQTQSEAAGGPGLTNLELSMPGGSRSRTPAQQEGKLGTGASRQVFSAQSYLRYQGDKVRRGVLSD
jgi:homoserine O-acetyltransferase